MKSVYKFFIVFIWSLFMVACSGGGDISDPLDPDPTPDEGTTTVVMTISTAEITAAAPAEITATVTNSKTGVMSGTLVSFSLNDASLGSFIPGTGTALTDSSGVAKIFLATSNIQGAGSVEVTVEDAEITPTKIGFNMAGDGGEVGGLQVVMALTDDSGNPIQNITSTQPGKLSATVTGLSKAAIVSFESKFDIVELPITTAVTDENGVATIDVYAGTGLGADSITASLVSGEEGDVVVVVGATNVQMGSGTPFVEGVAEVSTAVLSAGGTTTISVTIQDESGNPFTQPVDVNFSSTCSTSGKSVISSPVVAVNGIATSTYLAQGCVGDDNINVNANAGGLNLSATGSVSVLSADVGSIVYQSATPTNIGILGTGGVESSTVVFKVIDTNGDPVSNQSVSFSLNTDVGGVTILPLVATTNAQGLVQTVVNSGTVATSVRVTATVDGSNPVISSQSKELVISTGIPDQDSFSLSAEYVNAEGWDYDGEDVVITARLADAFNNLAPDGTAVSFTTEGGAIEPSCVTVNGVCSVKWTSQLPRPEGNTLLNASGVQVLEPQTTNFMGQSYGGRATITATAIGEESFPDSNGNGRFDESEVDAFLGNGSHSGNDVSGRPYDLAEAFYDYNEDGVYNPQQTGGEAGGTLEEYLDFNKNGNFDTKDAKYNGVLCSEPAHSVCADDINELKSVNVRASLVMVMSGSAAFGSTPVISDNGVDNGDNILDLYGKGSGGVSIIISDLHNQQMPYGTTITFTATAGSVASKASYTWGSSNFNGGAAFGVIVKGEDEPNSGSLIIEAETPNGTATLIATVPIIIH